MISSFLRCKECTQMYQHWARLAYGVRLHALWMKKGSEHFGKAIWLPLLIVFPIPLSTSMPMNATRVYVLIILVMTLYFSQQSFSIHSFLCLFVCFIFFAVLAIYSRPWRSKGKCQCWPLCSLCRRWVGWNDCCLSYISTGSCKDTSCSTGNISNTWVNKAIAFAVAYSLKLLPI